MDVEERAHVHPDVPDGHKGEQEKLERWAAKVVHELFADGVEDRDHDKIKEQLVPRRGAVLAFAVQDIALRPVRLQLVAKVLTHHRLANQLLFRVVVEVDKVLQGAKVLRCGMHGRRGGDGRSCRCCCSRMGRFSVRPVHGRQRHFGVACLYSPATAAAIASNAATGRGPCVQRVQLGSHGRQLALRRLLPRHQLRPSSQRRAAVATGRKRTGNALHGHQRRRRPCRAFRASAEFLLFFQGPSPRLTRVTVAHLHRNCGHVVVHGRSACTHRGERERAGRLRVGVKAERAVAKNRTVRKNKNRT